MRVSALVSHSDNLMVAGQFQKLVDYSSVGWFGKRGLPTGCLGCTLWRLSKNHPELVSPSSPLSG